MKKIQQLIEGTNYQVFPVNFHAHGQSMKGYAIVGGPRFTGFEYMGLPEVMVFEPTYERNRKTGQYQKIWKVTVHNDQFNPLGYSLTWCKPSQFKPFKKHLI